VLEGDYTFISGGLGSVRLPNTLSNNDSNPLVASPGGSPGGIGYSAVPEPSTIVLFAAALAAISTMRSRGR
jgi:hypothetical protein